MIEIKEKINYNKIIEMKNKKATEYLNFAHARTPEQIALMKNIDKIGDCPFCKENFKKYHPKPVLKKGKYWVVSENMFPYEGTRLHLIFIYLPKHITKIENANPKAGVELLKLISWAIKKYKLKGAGLFIRSGKTNLTGSSVDHLHAQLISGNSKFGSKNSSSLKVKLGYKKEKTPSK